LELNEYLYNVMVVCGPKASTFGLVLSIWGILQLAITGFLFHNRSVAFVDDLNLDQLENFDTPADLANQLEVKYEAGALNCWIAALMYVATLCVSVQQFWMNERVVEIKAELM
jgi:ribonuclease kappa